MSSPVEKAEETIHSCIHKLQTISEDSNIPRNIRRVADETRTLLSSEDIALNLRAAEAISRISEISSDSNMPGHARTRIWEVVSQLETVPLD
jgi:uncharacterized protein (UPF0147 family)